jgi:hypothetical protein
MQEKKWGDLLFIQLIMDLYKTGTGFACIIFLFPAGITGPAPAENALAETGYGVVG